MEEKDNISIPKRKIKHKCVICDKFVSGLEGHLKTCHNLTMDVYLKENPNAGAWTNEGEVIAEYANCDIITDSPDNPPALPPVDTYYAKDGTLKKVNGSRNLNENSIEVQLDKIFGENCSKVWNLVQEVLLYDKEKQRHAKAWYNSQDKLRAAELVLAYRYGRPKQRAENINTTKKLVVTLSVDGKDQKLIPEDLN